MQPPDPPNRPSAAASRCSSLRPDDGEVSSGSAPATACEHPLAPATKPGDSSFDGATPAAVCRPFEEGLHLVFVHPEIHWNTGNAGRTCLATGARLHLVEPLGFSLGEREVRRAGLDYWPRVPLSRWPSWEALAAVLPTLGTAFFFSAEAERPLWEVRFPRPSVLVFGRESDGLPAPLRHAHRDRLVRIPMAPDSVRSLNLSTAAALALYEVRRQWGVDAPRAAARV